MADTCKVCIRLKPIERKNLTHSAFGTIKIWVGGKWEPIKIRVEFIEPLLAFLEDWENGWMTDKRQVGIIEFCSCDG